MNLKENFTKEKRLFIALKYCTLNQEKIGSVFNLIERMLINQERGRLMAKDSAIENDIEFLRTKKIRFSKELKQKINFVFNKVENDESILNEILINLNETYEN